MRNHLGRFLEVKTFDGRKSEKECLVDSNVRDGWKAVAAVLLNFVSGSSDSRKNARVFDGSF